MKKLILLMCWMVSLQLAAQTYPFPQNVTYPYGKKPSNANHADALSAYNSWKNEFVVSSTCAGGSKRVKFDAANNSNHTVSEGIAYGMLLAAYAADQTTFDGLYKYYNGFLNTRGFMNWKVNDPTCAVVNANGATDADCDVAFALYVAHWQWGSAGATNYLQQSKNFIAKIKQYEIVSGTNVVRPGDDPSWTEAGTTLVNVSYLCPAYFRVFATIDTPNAAYWTAVANQCYTTLNNNLTTTNANATNGLVSDWSKPDGTVPGAGTSGYQYQGQRFYYDAVRTPWRVGLDYLWFGTAAAQTYCNKTTDFVKNTLGGSSNVKDGYYMNGSAFGTAHNNTFVGCFAVGAMASNITGVQAHLDASYTDNKNTNPFAGQYFNSTIKALTLFTLTGNFYKPPIGSCSTPNLGANQYLCSGTKTLNANVSATNRTFTWYKDGVVIAGATNVTYVASQAGVYEVKADSLGCLRTASVEIYPNTPKADFSYTIAGQTVTFKDLSTGGATQYSWDVGNGGSTVDYTTQNPVHAYSAAALYSVSLKVTNPTCGTNNTVTKNVPIGAPTSAGGWVTNDFTTANWQNVAPYTSDAAVITMSQVPCSEVTFACKTPTLPAQQYKMFGIVFKKTGANSPQDLSNYPYVTLRIKATAACSLRVDLADNNTTCGSITGPCTTSLTPISLDVTTSYQVLTLDFTGKFKNYQNNTVNASQIKELQFYPYANGTNGTSYNGTITIDWIIAGYATLPPPTIPSLALTYNACNGNLQTLDATDCHAESYLWSTGEKTASVSKGPGTYYVDATNFGGTTRKTVTVTSASSPVVGFSATTNGMTVNLSNGSTGATSYAWTFTGGTPTSSTQTNPSVTYPSNGTYNICLSATNTCGTTGPSCQLVTVTSTNILNPVNSHPEWLDVYPNPTNDELSVNFKVPNAKLVDLTITNAIGDVVMVLKAYDLNNAINMQALPAGVYLLTVQSNEYVATQKIIKK